MKLRSLQIKDIPFILEWMKDPEINCFFRFNADDVNENTVKQYILDSHDTEMNRHYAIANENNEYLGTISLKNIDRANATAEYAISLRRAIQGTGAARFATNELLRIAFNEIHLNKVYLNVLSENLRAIRFYEKMGFVYEGEFKEHLIINNIKKNLKWYRITKDEYENTKKIANN